MTPAPHAARALLGTLAVLALDLSLLALGVGGLGRLLHHPRALALFASWVVAYPILALLRQTRVRDAAASRPDPAVMLALFLIPFVTPPLSAWGERAGLWLLPGGTALRWSGVALSAAGLLLRIVAVHELGPRFAPVPALLPGHVLETRGVYAWVRHPGYLGSWLCNLGIVLGFGSALTLPLAALMALAIGLRVRSEERLLEEQFGDAYHAYRARVGAFLPRWRALPAP